MTAIWNANATDWVDDEGNSPNVKVTTLHWGCSLVDGEFTARSYGTTPDGQNRVYTKQALSNVPESVVIGWIKQALGDEEVARIEQALADNIAEQQNPTSGTVAY